jgi:CBS domain-containing protein
MLTIETIMTTDLVTLDPGDTLAQARDLMHEKKIHHLPVVDSENKLVGLITLTDLLASTDSRLRDRDERLRASEIRVEEVMTTDVATVDQHASLRNAALFLEKHKIGCLPVVTGDTLRGIITDTDFVAVAINLLEQLEINEPDDDFEEI